MSSGRTHTTASLLLAGGFLVGSLVALDLSGVQYSIGALVGVPLNPDLDVNHGRVDGNKIVRRAGLAPYYGWMGVWFMYRLSMKHGSLLSHLPVIGTVGRLVYLFLLVIVVPLVLLAPIFHYDALEKVIQCLVFILKYPKVIVGLICADIIHWALDVITRESK